MILKIGHRGMKSYQENTLESILYAQKHNMDAVEIDIIKTIDDSIILFHDKFININNKNYIIDESMYSNLNDKIETLDYVLSNIKVNSIKIFFDIKKCSNDKYFIYLFLNIIQQYLIKGWNKNNFYFQSFYAPYINILSDFNKIISNYGLIYCGLPLRPFYDIKKLNCNYICLDYEYIDYEDLQYLKKNINIDIYLYTINEKLFYNKFKNIVNGFITDDYKIFI